MSIGITYKLRELETEDLEEFIKIYSGVWHKNYFDKRIKEMIMDLKKELIKRRYKNGYNIKPYKRHRNNDCRSSNGSFNFN